MSDGYCDVEIGSDCDASSELFHVETRKARKQHRCEDCRCDIPAGAEYERATWKEGSRFISVCVCAACAEVGNEFMHPRVYGASDLWNGFKEEWANGANIQGCMNRVSSVAAKEKLLERWKLWKGI